MATVPGTVTWPSRSMLTSVGLNRVRSYLQFLALRSGGCCELTQTVVQDVVNLSDVPITFTSEEVDRDGGHSVLEATSRYTAQTQGYYLLSGVIGFAANATGYRVAKLRRTIPGAFSTTLTAACRPAQSGTGVTTFVPVGPRIIRLEPGYYVELVARQNSGGTLSTTDVDGGSGMTVIYMGAA